MKNPYLIGERVYFRPVEGEDAATIQPWLNDPEVRQYMRRWQPLNMKAEIEWIEKFSSDPAVLVGMIVRKEGDLPIGVGGLHNVDQRNRRGEFGITIGDKSCWGQGLGTEATKLAIEYGFLIANLHRIVLHVYEYNTRAIRCYEKIGFISEGVLRQDQFHNGRYWDTIVMSMLRGEWDSRQAETSRPKS